MNRVISVASCLSTFVLASVMLDAQIVTAWLEGTVHDPSDAVIAGAKVQVVNTSTNVVTHLTTDASGCFVAPSLPPGGPYTVLVDAIGFKRDRRSGITLKVNQSAKIDLIMQVGAASETVEVADKAPLLEAATADQGAVISNREVVDLPLNARNPYALVFLSPGVTGTTGTQFNSANFSVNGGRPGSTDILVDGIPSSPPLANPIQGFSAFPSIDVVEEFKVETNAYSAEFGRTGSGIINLIYKSGTNQVHGSAYEFLRNSDLDANSFFANRNGTPLGSFKRSQFGATMGGPIVIPKIYNGEDKTFFFVGYEGLRQSTAANFTGTVPTVAERTGDFSQLANGGQLVVIYDPSTTVASGSGFVRSPFPGNIIHANQINPVAANIAKYYPLPNVGGPGALVNNFFSPGSSVNNSNQVDSKFDENINDRNRFFFHYSWKKFTAPVIRVFPGATEVAQGAISPPMLPSGTTGAPGNTLLQQFNSAALDYTFSKSPTFLIDFRYGLARTGVAQNTVSEGFDPTTLGFPSYIAKNADHLLFPGIVVNNYVSLGNAGQGQFRRSGFESHSATLNNTKVATNHVLKFGGEFRLLRVNDVQSASSTGNFTFTQALTQGPSPTVGSATAGNSFASLLLGYGSGTLLVNSKNAATLSQYLGFYFQDDWKVNAKLTLNLGIRWDAEIPRTERYNQMETFDPSVPSPLAGPTGIAGLRGGLRFVGVNGYPRNQYDARWTDWAPRIGFAFQSFPNTVIRGGYGIFFAPSYRQAGSTIGNQGFSSSTSYNGIPDNLHPTLSINNPFPNGFNPIVGSSQGLLTGIGTSFETPVYRDNHVPYTQNWDLDIQQQIGGDVLIDAAYVGSHGVQLNSAGETEYNLNQLPPQVLTLGNRLLQSVPNPFYGIITTGPLSAAQVPLSNLVAPFPQFLTLQDTFPTGGYSLYHAFQLKVEKRFGLGLSALLSFTGQKLIDNFSVIAVGNNTGGLQNIYDRSGDRATSSNDISKHLTVCGVYNLPFGRGQRIGANWNRTIDAMLGGWSVNAIATAQTGFPLSPTTQNTSNANSNILRPNNNGHSAALSGPVSARLGGYLNAAVFSQPVPFTFGNAPRTLPDVRAMGNENIDLSLFKTFRLNERLSAQFRAEVFNVLNQVVFGSPNMVLSSGQFGAITGQSNSPRQLQFAFKLLF